MHRLESALLSLLKVDLSSGEENFFEAMMDITAFTGFYPTQTNLELKQLHAKGKHTTARGERSTEWVGSQGREQMELLLETGLGELRCLEVYKERFPLDLKELLKSSKRYLDRYQLEIRNGHFVGKSFLHRRVAVYLLLVDLYVRGEFGYRSK